MVSPRDLFLLFSFRVIASQAKSETPVKPRLPTNKKKKVLVRQREKEKEEKVLFYNETIRQSRHFGPANKLLWLTIILLENWTDIRKSCDLYTRWHSHRPRNETLWNASISAERKDNDVERKQLFESIKKRGVVCDRLSLRIICIRNESKKYKEKTF